MPAGPYLRLASHRAIETTPLGDYTMMTHLIAGGVGGGATAALSTPFDTVKVRMQTKVYATAADPYPSIMTVVRRHSLWCRITLVWGGSVRRYGWRRSFHPPRTICHRRLSPVALHSPGDLSPPGSE